MLEERKRWSSTGYLFRKVRASLSRGALHTFNLQPDFTEFVLSVASKVNSMSASRISVHVHPLRPALRNCVLVRLSSPAEPPALCVPVGSQVLLCPHVLVCACVSLPLLSRRLCVCPSARSLFVPTAAPCLLRDALRSARRKWPPTKTFFPCYLSSHPLWRKASRREGITSDNSRVLACWHCRLRARAVLLVVLVVGTVVGKIFQTGPPHSMG